MWQRRGGGGVEGKGSDPDVGPGGARALPWGRLGSNLARCGDVAVGLLSIAHALPLPQLPGGGDPVADVGARCGAAGAARGPSVPPPGRGVSGALPSPVAHGAPGAGGAYRPGPTAPGSFVG